MSKPISIGQSHAVISALTANVDWEALDPQMLQKIIDNPKEAGKQFTIFIENGGSVILGGSNIIKIDRKPFNPETFMGKGWSIVEEDKRSLTLTEIDLNKVVLKTTLKENEKSVSGEERLRRLKEENGVRLDANIFKTLWENQKLIPESWKKKTNGNITYIFFDGTVLRRPFGYRWTLYLCWDDGGWRWSYDWLGSDWGADGPSALLAI